MYSAIASSDVAEGFVLDIHALNLPSGLSSTSCEHACAQREPVAYLSDPYSVREVIV